MTFAWTERMTAGLLLGIAAGFIMHRSDYCLASMFRDPFLSRDLFLLRTLLLLVVTSMLLFEGARRAGLLPFYPFPLLGPPSLSNLAGGFLFGIGMVLAGGCVVGTLYKMGSGSMVSLAAFFGLIAGSALSALLLREFQVHRGIPPSQLALAFCGGTLLGLASRMAPGCNVWHLMGGLPLLALQSILFLIGLVPGAWAGARLIRKFLTGG